MSAEPALWRDVMLSNREELLAQSKIFQNNLQALELMISSGNAEALEELIRAASTARARISHWRMESGVKLAVKGASLSELTNWLFA